MKAYPRGTDMGQERQALALGEAARAAGVLVPAVRRTVTGEMIASASGLSVSVTEYVTDAETAEGGLSGGRWDAVGEAVGRLHRALARHPVGPPRPVAAREVCDVARAGRRLEELLARGAAAPPAQEVFAAWCAQAAKQRLAALPRLSPSRSSPAPRRARCGTCRTRLPPRRGQAAVPCRRRSHCGCPLRPYPRTHTEDDRPDRSPGGDAT